MPIKSKPAFYTKELSDDGKNIRNRLEESLAAELNHEKYLDTQNDPDAMVACLAKQDLLNDQLFYQGANPRELELEDLEDLIHTKRDTDSFNLAAARGRIKNQATAIRAYCIQCQGDDVSCVRNCTTITCVLWPFRMGKNPLFGVAIPASEENSNFIEDTEDDEFYTDEEESND